MGSSNFLRACDRVGRFPTRRSSAQIALPSWLPVQMLIFLCPNHRLGRRGVQTRANRCLSNHKTQYCWRGLSDCTIDNTYLYTVRTVESEVIRYREIVRSNSNDYRDMETNRGVSRPCLRFHTFR